VKIQMARANPYPSPGATDTSLLNTPALKSNTFSAPGSSGLPPAASWPARHQDHLAVVRCRPHLMREDAGSIGLGGTTSSPGVASALIR